jgi:RNA-binding protein Tab2/Atab2
MSFRAMRTTTRPTTCLAAIVAIIALYASQTASLVVSTTSGISRIIQSTPGAPQYLQTSSSGNRVSTISGAPLAGRVRARDSLTTTSHSMLSSDSMGVGYAKSGELNFPDDMSEEWEIDCYSRPVTADDGKKLWEVLITDSKGSFRYLKTLPSNLVNSRNLRKAVEEVMEQAPVRPRVIRFFRNQMFNMITIALSTLDLEVKPSRRTHNLFMWLEEREANIYPTMSGYNAELKQQTILDYDVTQPDRLPDVLKAESYAFVALPAEVFWDGQVNSENINRGRLCPLKDMPKTGWIHGITLFSKRADAVAAWMNGLEIAYLRGDLLTRELMLNCDIR